MVVNGKFQIEANMRVISYIDRFNLYFGLRAQGWRKYMWLDLTKLSSSILPPNSTLIETKYFTSRVRGNVGKQDRQSAYLDALATLPNISFYWGRFQPDEKQCQRCGHLAFHPQEKKTDVNIATQLLCDAFHNRFDAAFLISGDADLVPPIAAVKELFPKKRIVVAFPPRRYSSELAKTAHAQMNIFETKFRQSRLPDRITLASGDEVRRPESWR